MQYPYIAIFNCPVGRPLLNAKMQAIKAFDTQNVIVCNKGPLSSTIVIIIKLC